MAALVAPILVNCATDQGIAKKWEPDKRADVRTQLAVNYMQRNQLQIARTELEQALAIQPDHSAANHAMAALQDRLGNDALAEQHYRRAVQVNPENSRAMHDYGTFLCRRQRVNEAIQQFEKALANPLYQEVAMTFLRAGECLAQNSDHRNAEQYFRKALQSNPSLPSALYFMADIQFQRGDYLPARGYIERYFSTASETPESLLLAFKIERQLNSADVAADYASRLRNRFPGSAEAGELAKLMGPQDDS